MTDLTNTTRKALARVLIKYLDQQIARPSAKAFIFAYLYVVLPKIFNRVIVSVQQGKLKESISSIGKILYRALHPLKFPMFAANLIGGINLLEPIIYGMVKKSKILSKPQSNLFVATFISSFLAAVATFPVFQGHILSYGRYFSLDLTLLVATRALDTTLSSTLSKIMPVGVAGFGDSLLFLYSCSFIMYSWFYHPEALPPAYRNWITSAADMDTELIEVLKLVKEGTIEYGKESEAHKDILAPLCERYGQDKKRGDLVTNIPIECELVHSFKTKNCELHSLWRFARGFSFAMKIYGPINALMLLIPKKNVSMKLRIIRALRSSIRSSCFLGTFIGLYWYAVCLSRTRLLPKIFPQIPRSRWDNTIGPTAGALLCGFSSLIETPIRRKELALFVAPRAMGTFVPSTPTKLNMMVERVVFSLSMAVLVAYSKSNPKNVRGIFGKGLQQVFHIQSYI